MNTRKHWRIRSTSSKIPCPWFSVPCRAEKNFCQINRCLGHHVISFLPCQSNSTTPKEHVVCWDPEIKAACVSQWDPWQPVLQSVIQHQVEHRPVDTQKNGTWMLSLAGKNGFSPSHGLRSSMCSRSACPHFPRPHFTEKSSTQDRATFLQLLSAWLARLPLQQGRQELPQDSPRSRGSEPTVTSQPCLSWLVGLWKH
jgi:hypothetical protein